MGAPSGCTGGFVANVGKKLPGSRLFSCDVLAWLVRFGDTSGCSGDGSLENMEKKPPRCLSACAAALGPMVDAFGFVDVVA